MPNFAIPGLMDLSTPGSDAIQPWVPLANHDVNNTLWQGIPAVGPITINGSPIPVEAAAAVMKFSAGADGKVLAAFKCTTDPEDGDGAVTLVDAAAWTFSVPAQALGLPVGLWYWWFVVTDANGNTTPAYRGTLVVQ